MTSCKTWKVRGQNGYTRVAQQDPRSWWEVVVLYVCRPRGEDEREEAGRGTKWTANSVICVVLHVLHVHWVHFYVLFSAISQARMNQKTKVSEVQGTLLLLKKMLALWNTTRWWGWGEWVHGVHVFTNEHTGDPSPPPPDFIWTLL